MWQVKSAQKIVTRTLSSNVHTATKTLGSWIFSLHLIAIREVVALNCANVLSMRCKQLIYQFLPDIDPAIGAVPLSVKTADTT
jgi:hypothetical protein